LLIVNRAVLTNNELKAWGQQNRGTRSVLLDIASK
jgi:hypothetical protein